MFISLTLGEKGVGGLLAPCFFQESDRVTILLDPSRMMADGDDVVVAVAAAAAVAIVD